ncbi:hypothetical protein ILYODFUR_034923 [Ilyodon furcidens]|uniref:Immunoglobulin subtype domain-containing protein n=1 Tax=Ilyodon furcidens TaxID=33524 RepID=A0ABV0SRP1_9TELE
MEQFLLLLIFAGTTCALSIVPETKCDAIQIIVSCAPVPGATVYIQLMTNATGYVLEFNKNLPGHDIKVFIVKNGKVKIRESYRNRTEFFIDTGTLKITDVEEDDAGQYTLKAYKPNGEFVQMLSFTLNVKGKDSRSIDISIPAVVGVLILILVGCVVWKLKPCRKTGYQTLN